MTSSIAPSSHNLCVIPVATKIQILSCDILILYRVYSFLQYRWISEIVLIFAIKKRCWPTQRILSQSLIRKPQCLHGK